MTRVALFCRCSCRAQPAAQIPESDATADFNELSVSRPRGRSGGNEELMATRIRKIVSQRRAETGELNPASDNIGAAVYARIFH